MKFVLTLIFSLPLFCLSAQDKTLPYYEIPSYPENFTAGSVAARMIGGFGFRYYWATEGLRPEDLAYTPGADTRTSSEETLTHIYELSQIIANSVTKTPNTSEATQTRHAFQEMRKRTLENLKLASDRLRTAIPFGISSMALSQMGCGMLGKSYLSEEHPAIRLPIK